MKEINIAKVITRKRKEKGITQDALAEYIGVTKASVSKWETGQSYPDITLLPKLATFFNISIDDLISYLPQMEKGEIRRTYGRFAEDFGKKPFSEVYEEVGVGIDKYYACFPLLLQMSILLLNHYMLAETEELRSEVLEKILHLCRRVKEESEDVWLSKQANSIEAMTQMIRGESLEVLELLEGTIRPIGGDEITLAGAYQSRGEMEKAKSVLQISMYHHILNFISTGASYLTLNLDDLENFEGVLRRLLPVAEAMKLMELNPNVMGQIHFAAAYGYAVLGEEEKSVSMLKEYVRVCKKISYPYKLKGDDFFTLVDPWLEDLDLGNGPPRGEKVVKEGMLHAVTMNPAFTVLHEHTGYKNIISELTDFVGGK
ncbi:helix-turn-helix domain-containing protein [Proteiniclasticum sp. C24MP]|uniref:helix-turn-helix domain-containing protein n=1 Tax=Proteiniclasticum sp. C24MP TaxID=3374101 RepID=UPI0037545A24